MKLLVLLILVGILVSLGSALFHLARRERDSKKMVRALTWRISLSVGLFALLLLAWALGLVEPHGVAGNR